MYKDFTIIVNGHSEGFICGPTIKSLEASLAFAKHISVDVHVILDSPCPSTVSVFKNFCRSCSYADLDIVDFKDLSQARTYGISKSKSEFIAFLDADDLFSANWIIESHRFLVSSQQNNTKIICHPEVNIFFEGVNSIVPNEARPSFTQSPTEYFARNPFDSLMAAPLSLFLETSYRDIRLADGYGYEDWALNIESEFQGWRHEIVPNTFIAKRRRQGSLVTISDSAKVVIDHKAIPEISLFKP